VHETRVFRQHDPRPPDDRESFELVRTAREIDAVLAEGMEISVALARFSGMRSSTIWLRGWRSIHRRANSM
jgi:hypothetical protein